MSSWKSLQPRVSKCRSCGAPIFFARLLSGNLTAPAPINAEATQAAARPVVVSEGDAWSAPADWKGRTYQVHFETCPQTKAWRAKRGIQEPVQEPAQVNGGRNV